MLQRTMLERTLLRCLAAVGTVTAVLALAAVPAAARAPGDLQITALDEHVWPGGGALGLVQVYLGDRQVDLLEVDIDISEIADFTEFLVAPFAEWQCDTTATRVHCETRDAQFSASFYYQVFGLDNGVPTGHSGTIRLVATAGADTAESSAKITMAEPVDLATAAEIPMSAPPGSPFGLQLPVRNVGPNTASGTVLTFEPHEFTAYRGQFSNCTSYQVFIECVFDQDLAPGKTYGFSTDIPVDMDPRARTGAVVGFFVEWWTAVDWDRVDESWKQDIAGGVPGVPGTGDPLTLVERAARATARGLPQTDVDEFTNFATVKVTVTGDHPADVAAVGATAAGPVGATVRALLEVRNLGPADLLDGFSLEVPLAYVSVPAGTTAVEVPSACAPFTTLEDWNPLDEGGTTGADRYACQGDNIAVGGTLFGYEFGFRIDQVIVDAAGAFTVDLAGDPNAANDTAKIVINPAGGGDGGLPVTGASLGLLIAVGALLLGVGVAVLFLARRRRIGHAA